MKKFYLILLITYNLFGSSFDGSRGNVSSIELSDSEKLIFKNQKALQTVKRDVTKLKLQMNSVKENIDGMKSILESTNDKISQTSQRNSKVSDQEVLKLQKRVDKLEKDNNKRFKKIEKSLDRLIKMLSSSKNTTNQDKEDVIKKLKPIKKVKKITAKEAFKKGENLFKKKKYKNALEMYLTAADKKYNLPLTYFKMGESFYYQKKYDEAIVYYKKSVNIKDDSPFLAKLLFHTGVSFKNTGDKQGAKKFLEAVKEGFPTSSYAKLANKLLKKL